jgi:hypothetical protein
MSVWVWVGVGVVAMSVLALLIGLAVAKVLAGIAAEASAMIEAESWATSALTRATPERPQEAHAGRRATTSRS